MWLRCLCILPVSNWVLKCCDRKLDGTWFACLWKHPSTFFKVSATTLEWKNFRSTLVQLPGSQPASSLGRATYLPPYHTNSLHPCQPSQKPIPCLAVTYSSIPNPSLSNILLPPTLPPWLQIALILIEIKHRLIQAIINQWDVTQLRASIC